MNEVRRSSVLVLGVCIGQVAFTFVCVYLCGIHVFEIEVEPQQAYMHHGCPKGPFTGRILWDAKVRDVSCGLEMFHGFVKLLQFHAEGSDVDIGGTGTILKRTL